ncbi:MAG TPA: anaerobic ribonucleoside-triphosphate reductase [Candidatus Omnitrophota bacterium]|nr:anaerobic ribonucleoside-triphosphate reductase [Candidatus Omnitrophota bacterium]
MTLEELDAYLEARPHILWATDEAGNIYFRHESFDGENDKTKVEPKALAELTPDKLDRILTGGRNVEHITRVTGYFSRVGGWNKGKKGELHDRHRVQV